MAEVHRVVTLVRHGVMPMELGIVHQLFRQARSAAGRPLYEVVTCAGRAGGIRTDADFEIRVTHGAEALEGADTVLVPASHELDDTGRAAEEAADAAGAGLLARIRPGARVASICTGAFLLAAAGLLDGRRATTHWRSAERLRNRYPRVEVDPEVLFVDEGEVLTSAGEAAGIDLCLHMIRRDHGAAVANAVARATVVPPFREGGQAQFIPQPVPECAGSSTGEAREWALRNLERPIGLRELAARQAMSMRTFSRRFRRETGTTPGHWLIQQRIERARRLLEETDRTIDRIADEVGFGTAVSLRQNFQARIGVTPSAYRATFRGPGPGPGPGPGSGPEPEPEPGPEPGPGTGPATAGRR